jgi:ribosomal protein L20
MNKKRRKIKKELHSLWFLREVWEMIEEAAYEYNLSYSNYIAQLVVNKHKRRKR